MPENYTWRDLVAKAFEMKLNLSTMNLVIPFDNSEKLTVETRFYDIDAIACTEVLIDVLTGETQVTRTDILYDCGQRFGPDGQSICVHLNFLFSKI
jgi:xanthine dehydrogenase/oxidase